MTTVGALTRGACLDDVRAVHASAAAVHSALTNAFGAQGFRLTNDQLTYLEARRGSSVMGAVDKSKLGVLGTAWVTPGGDGCQVQIRLQYRGIPLSTGTGQAVVREALLETGRSIDVALSRLDPDASFVSAVLTTTGPAGPVQEQIDLGVASQEAQAPAARSGMPEAWTASRGALFTFGNHMAWLDPPATQAHLAVARLVLDRPGALPDELHAQLEPFAVRVEQAVAANPDGLAVLPVSSEERTVLAFMHQQARIRSAMPVRVLHRCRDCHLEKVTNPAYQRAVQHSRNMRSLGGAIGATVTRGGITPMVLMGTLFQFNRLDPDYVCPRCQGMSAEETFVTFCSSCGELRKDAVLRTCPSCQFDYRSLLRKEQFWVRAPAQSPRPVAPVGPNGGKICRTCGREFSSLWRVVVRTGDRQEEWYVCATTPQCTPDSLVDPVLA